MKIDCPHGYSSKSKLGNITFEFRDVNIFGNVCDHADLCAIETCRYYDITREGTRRYMEAMLACEASIEKQLEDKDKEKRYRKRQQLGLRIIEGGTA
jgi:hypothetical protein